MRSMRVVKRARERKRERERERRRDKHTHTHTEREREQEKMTREQRELRTSERARGGGGGGGRGGGEKRREIRTFPQNRCFSSFFSFFFLSLFRVFAASFFTQQKQNNAQHTERKEREARVIMDESWEELKRNAILLGSWIALIRASTYIFGAFQKAD